MLPGGAFFQHNQVIFMWNTSTKCSLLTFCHLLSLTANSLYVKTTYMIVILILIHGYSK